MRPPPVTCALLLGLVEMSTEVCAEVGDETNKIQTIANRGERVDLEGYVVKGKYTLFEFYAEWSPEWKKMAPEIEAKVKSGDDVVLRRINVRSWTSPVVKQHGILAIPHYKLYDPNGKLMRAYSPAAATAKTPRKNETSKSESSKRASPVSRSPYRAPKVAASKVLTICAKGERVDLNKHLAKGYYTLFEFYADW